MYKGIIFLKIICGINNKCKRIYMYIVNKYDSGVYVNVFDFRYIKCDSFIRDLEEGKF